MIIGERERHALHQALDEVIGPDVASILMGHLPPVGWADVATKHDLVELEGRLNHRLDASLDRLRVDLYREIGGLRTELHTEIGGLRSELHTEIGGLRSELHTEIGGLRSEFHAALHAMSRTNLLGNIALVFTVVAVAFAAARLI